MEVTRRVNTRQRLLNLGCELLAQIVVLAVLREVVVEGLSLVPLRDHATAVHSADEAVLEVRFAITTAAVVSAYNEAYTQATRQDASYTPSHRYRDSALRRSDCYGIPAWPPTPWR